MGKYDKENEKRKNIRKLRELNGICIYCGKSDPKENKKGCESCLVKKSEYNKNVSFAKEKRQQYNLSIKHDVINKYGGKCSCCGENQILFLTIDHINNDGYKDIDNSFYFTLRKDKIRDDLQVMCFNCNCGKSLNDGICPHKKINRSIFPFEDERYGSKALLNKNTKINWPSDEELINMCNESSINSVKGKLNVCYNTIVKRLKRRNKFHLVKLRKTRPKSKPNLSL